MGHKKHNNNNNVGGKLAVGALVGGLAGYVAGILTAPKSGKQTRSDITNKTEALRDGAETQLQDTVDELNNALVALKGKSVALSSKAREEYDEKLITAKDAQNKAVQVLKAFKAGEADDPELNKAVKQGRAALKNLSRYLKS